jgi:Ca2+-binding EF-hand superfamily protein
MNTSKSHSFAIACTVVLFALPAAFAGGDKHFKKMDANGDGQVTRAEHATSARQMFTQCDANHDGIVTAAEMDSLSAVKDEKAGKHETTSAEKIKMIDQNGDGQLTLAEHEAGTEKMFTAMDKNADGSLSKDECHDAQKEMKKDK